MRPEPAGLKGRRGVRRSFWDAGACPQSPCWQRRGGGSLEKCLVRPGADTPAGKSRLRPGAVPTTRVPVVTPSRIYKVARAEVFSIDGRGHRRVRRPRFADGPADLRV